MDKYRVSYSEDAVQDLRDIYEYIAFELNEPGIAIAQARRIRDSIRRLDIFSSSKQSSRMGTLAQHRNASNVGGSFYCILYSFG